MSDDALRRELAYYKRHLDELAAQRISIEHHQWALHMQLRQKKQGFQLLSRLARSVGVQTELTSIFRITVLAIHSALGMDRTVILVPTSRAHSYAAVHFAGLSEDLVERLTNTSFQFPADFAAGTGLLLVNSSSEQTPLIAKLRETFGVESFVCVPIMGYREPIGIIFAGRLWGHSAVFPALDQGDADTLRAMTGILQAVVQNTRLGLFEQKERLKAGLFADVAHEFRTPLTLTLGPLAQILAGKWGELPLPIQDRLRVVERNQERLLGLINQMLDLARLEAGAAELREAPIADLNELVKECAAHFRPAAEARGLELNLSLDPRLDESPLLADREKLERVLFNLLSNALKFTDQGHVDVTTTLQGESLELAVADTGIGIIDEDLPHVFERFRRAGGGSDRPPGSGIGLALVKQMTELHGGQVAVQSRKGKGSRFAVRIPLKVASQAQRDHAADEERQSSPRAARLDAQSFADEGAIASARGDVDIANRAVEAAFDAAKPIVLYVEDDADLRCHVRDILGEDCNLFLACDGADGLEKARRYLPDAVVTDQMMPRMDGREFLFALRNDRDLRSIPVVFLTAQYGTEGRIESLDAGADDYITKPFHEVELRARLKNLIRARAHQRELAELNRRLELRVREQMAELVRTGELQRFLPRTVIDTLLRHLPERRISKRRYVTILVTELTALAAFGELADEPAVAGVMNEYLGAIATISAAQGATVDGMTGGRISIVFGAPEERSPEEAAWEAVQAALEIHAKTLQLTADARRRGLCRESASGIGIGSGFCMVGAFGNDTLRAYTAIGSAARVAAKLHAGAAPASIVCDHATWSLLKGRVRGHPIEDEEPQRSLRQVDRYEITELNSTGQPLSSSTPSHEPAQVGQQDGWGFRREGEYWTVVYQGRVFRLRDSKGASYLGRLLAQPHTEFHVLDLVQTTPSDEPTDRWMSASEAAKLGLHQQTRDHVGPVLDVHAKAEYRERLEDLELVVQEAKAAGLGGRNRKTGALTERFRINVTRTIKAVIRKITLANPDLGRHLRANVRTGTFCSYSPRSGAPHSWNVSW